MPHCYALNCDVETAFSKLSDPEFLDARNVAIGELESHSTVERQAEQTTIRMTRRFIRRGIPRALRKVFNPEQTVEFVEQWRRDGDSMVGRYRSDILGIPVTLRADIRLRPVEGGAEYQIDLQPEARVPLVGAMIEKYILGQSRDGIGAEIEYLNASLPQ